MPEEEELHAEMPAVPGKLPVLVLYLDQEGNWYVGIPDHSYVDVLFGEDKIAEASNAAIDLLVTALEERVRAMTEAEDAGLPG